MRSLKLNILTGFTFFVIAVIYLFVCIRYTTNNPYTSDDVYLFLHQFNSQFLSDKNNFIDRVLYFFKVTLYPHPKISSKAILVSSYLMLDEVNFKFMQIIGSSFSLIFAYVLSKMANSKIASLTIWTLILVPLYINFWTIFITGFPFIMTGVLLSFYFLVKERLIPYSILIVLVTFMQGSGFLCSIISIIFVLINFFYYRKKSSLLYIIPPVLGMCIFFLILSESNSSRSNLEFSYLLNKAAYFFNFLAFGISKYFSKMNYQFYGWIFGIPMFVFSIYKFIQLLKNNLKSDKEKVLLLFLGFITSVVFLATVIRSKQTDIIFTQIIPRYESYSIAYLCTFYLLLLRDSFFRKMNKVILFIIFFSSVILYQNRVMQNLNHMKIISARKTEKTFHKLANADKKYQRKGETKYLRRAYETGLYNPNFFQFVTAGKTKVVDLPTEFIDVEYSLESHSFKSIKQFQLCIAKTKGLVPILLIGSENNKFERINGTLVNDMEIKAKCANETNNQSLNFWIEDRKGVDERIFLALSNSRKIILVQEILNEM